MKYKLTGKVYSKIEDAPKGVIVSTLSDPAFPLATIMEKVGQDENDTFMEYVSGLDAYHRNDQGTHSFVNNDEDETDWHEVIAVDEEE